MRKSSPTSSPPSSAIPRFPSRRFLRPGAVLLAAACLGLGACRQVGTISETYADGARKSVTAFFRNGNGDTVLHGPRIAWYPDGRRESMETFANGSLNGYVLHWYPDGSLESAEHFTDGERDGQARFWDAAGGLTACYDARSRDCMTVVATRESLSGRMAESP